MSSNIIITIVVIVYLLFMLWIGWYSSTKISTNTDLMVTGRRLGPLLMTDALAATEIGGGSSLGAAQSGMLGFGLSAFWYITTMGIVSIILSFVTPKFKTVTARTVSEYFRGHYGKSYGIIATIIMPLLLVGLTTGQFIASAVILPTMLNIDYQVVIIVVTIVVTAYFIIGGLWSVTLTDFVQVFLIVIDMIIAVPFAINRVGGWGNVASNIPRGTLSLLQGYDLFGIASLVIMCTVTLFIGQEAVSRFYAARDEKAAKGGAWLAVLVSFICAFVPTILGIITLALINMGKFSSAQFEPVGARYILPVLTISTMPALIRRLPFVGIISAIMSSPDSDLLGAGSIFANDIYRVVLKPDASGQSVMKVTKIVMCLVGLASISIVLFNTQSAVSILMLCFTLGTAGPFFLYVIGHYWKKASAAGAIAFLIAGTIVVIYLEHISKGMLFGIKFSQLIIPGLATAFICSIIFSLAISPEKGTTELTPEGDG